MRKTLTALLMVILAVGFNGFEAAEAGPCPEGYEAILVRDTLQCAHPDQAPVATPRPTSFYSASAEARSLTCIGDGTEGNRLQALFVTDGPATLTDADRDAITQGMINVQSVYRTSSRLVSDASLVPRWVHTAGCEPSIEVVQVAPAALGDFASTIRAVAGQGHSRADRKYIMWTDSDAYCGIAAVSIDETKVGNRNDGTHPGYARTDRACWGYQGSVIAHEVTHTLGAVQPSAPNATPDGHCTDEYDIMCYTDGPGTVTTVACPATASDLVLDCNNDDYFHPEPPPGSWLSTHWNVADSSFLERMTPPEVIVADESGSRPAHSFTDVDAAGPHGRAIAWLADRGITRGCDTGRFCPDQPVSRGQMAAFLHRFVPGLGPVSAASGFADVGAGNPFAGDIAWLVSTGITRGCGAADFCPDLEVTRAQMAAFLYRVFGGGAEAEVAGFHDVPVAGPYSKEISWLASTGISNGCADGRFCPDQPVTRAQMASFLQRSAEMFPDD